MIGAEGEATLGELLQRNRIWAQGKTARDPGFFARLAGQQMPRFFWIGCADSRVPATEIVDLDPGEMFVHRNVANLAPAGDANFEAALGYAVKALKVSHILLVGHYGCGGVEAALVAEGGEFREWLEPLCETRDHHRSELALLDPDARRHRLCELNVLSQVHALAQNDIVRTAWEQAKFPVIHGLIYAVGDGLLGHICTASPRDGDTVIVKSGYRPAFHSLSMS